MEKTNLNILPTGGVLPIVHCSQGDIGRQFQINLYSDGVPYILDGTEELTIDGHKDDNNIFSYSLDPVTGSTITISTEEQMTACAGNVVCEIRIYKGTTRLGTCNFIIQVEEGPSNGTPSASTLQALDEIRAEIQQAVEDSESYADASKAWAVGPNGSGSGSDTNNSKYYAQESASSATASANSAADSKNWAVGPSGSGSGTDSNNSKYYSQQASSSASSASTSETNAKNWAVGPSGSGSGTDTNNAKYYSTQADSAKSDAVQAKNDAVSAKNAAESSATDSKNWAVGPSGSGSGTDSNNSKYYAGQASSSASDAINAKTSAEAAQQKIENMTVSASQLPEGSSPTVNKSEVGGVVNLAFGIPKGDTGDTGPRGADGLGVPAGGTTGQVLAKASDTDNDTEWITPSGGSSLKSTVLTTPTGYYDDHSGVVIYNQPIYDITDNMEVISVSGTEPYINIIVRCPNILLDLLTNKPSGYDAKNRRIYISSNSYTITDIGNYHGYIQAITIYNGVINNRDKEQIITSSLIDIDPVAYPYDNYPWYIHDFILNINFAISS